MNVWRINSLIFTLLLSILVFGITVILYFALSISPLWFLAPTAILISRLTLNAFLYPRIRYARWRYEVTEDEIDIEEGLFFITRTIIPIVRVQYSDTSQGPILRRFGLSSVSIVTAGGEKSIPGLVMEEADALRDRIAALAKNLQEGV